MDTDGETLFVLLAYKSQLVVDCCLATPGVSFEITPDISEKLLTVLSHVPCSPEPHLRHSYHPLLDSMPLHSKNLR